MEKFILGKPGGAIAKVESFITSRLLSRARERSNRYPSDLFTQLMLSLPATSLETMPIHITKNSEVYFYLNTRPKNDPILDWAGKYHGIGVMILNQDVPKDTSVRLAWDKLSKTEIGKKTDIPMELITRELMVGGRGVETARIHTVLVPDDLSEGRYFKIKELGGVDIIEHHKVILANVFNTLPSFIDEGRLQLGGIDIEKVSHDLWAARNMFSLHS